VTLRWLIQQDGVIAIPRTSKEKNARSNFAISDFALSDDEMARISALASPSGRLVNLAMAPEWDKD
jgi:diketogulonate reductase-like aldo/keto reductase